MTEGETGSQEYAEKAKALGQDGVRGWWGILWQCCAHPFPVLKQGKGEGSWVVSSSQGCKSRVSTLPQKYLAHWGPRPGQSGKGGSRGEESLIHMPEALPGGCRAQGKGPSSFWVASCSRAGVMPISVFHVPTTNSLNWIKVYIGEGRGLGIRLDRSRAGRYYKPRWSTRIRGISRCSGTK